MLTKVFPFVNVNCGLTIKISNWMKKIKHVFLEQQLL